MACGSVEWWEVVLLAHEDEDDGDHDDEMKVVTIMIIILIILIIVIIFQSLSFAAPQRRVPQIHPCPSQQTPPPCQRSCART